MATKKQEVNNQDADFFWPLMLGGLNIALTLSYMYMSANISFTTMVMTAASVVTGWLSLSLSRENIIKYRHKFEDAPDFKLERNYATIVLWVARVMVIASWVVFAGTSLAVSM